MYELSVTGASVRAELHVLYSTKFSYYIVYPVSYGMHTLDWSGLQS
jgi:hypothetical protein